MGEETRAILHADLNAFFAGCEIVSNPDKYNMDSKIIVAGDPRKRTGIVLACSYAVKKYGVKTTMLVSKARDICPDAIFLPPNHELYSAMSDRVMNILKDYSPIVEQSSIDEAYIDVTGCEKLFGQPEEIAYKIKTRVRKELSLTMSIGVSYNRLMAKMGSDYKKPDAITVITKEDVPVIIWPLPVRELIGIGKQTEVKLKNLGIMTIGDLAQTPVNQLTRMFGKFGEYLHNSANGIDDTPLVLNSEMKGIGNSTTLPSDLVNLDSICIIARDLIENVCYRLRKSGVLCKTVQVTLRDADFNTKQHQATLVEETDIPEDIYYISRKLLKELWKSEKIRLVGVRVSNFCSRDVAKQVSLFDDNAGKEKKRKIYDSLDKIHDKFGDSVIFKGYKLFEKDIKDK